MTPTVPHIKSNNVQATASNTPNKLLRTVMGASNSLLSKTKGDKVIWGIVLVLTLISLLVVYSATSSLAYKTQQGNTIYLLKQVVLIIAGFVIIYISHLVNYTFYARTAIWLFIISVLLLIYTKVFGHTTNQATRWIRLPIVNITFQTSDFAKLALFMYLSLILSRKQNIIHNFRKAFLPIIFPILTICVLIAIDNFSTGALLFLSCMVVCFIGRVHWKHLAIIVAFGVSVLGSLTWAAVTYYDPQKEELKELPAYLSVARVPTWISRIQVFIYPSKKGDRSNDHQANQARIAVAKGFMFGKGPGKSVQKNFLPDSFSDFIYAIVIEEYGLLGGGFLLFLYLLFLFRCIRIFKRCPYAFGAFLALGLSFTLVIQALFNMAVAVSLFPVTGVTLPLVSMGGTSFIATCISIGIILSVARNVEVMEGKQLAENALAQSEN